MEEAARWEAAGRHALNRTRILALFSLLLLVGGADRADAQFGGTGGEQGNVDPKTYKQRYNVSLSIFPLAIFDVGGIFSGQLGTQSLAGGLVDVELSTRDKNGGKYAIGSWYWGRDGSDLYEVHARLESKNGLGIQAGYLNTTQGFFSRAPNTTVGQGGITRNSGKQDAESYDVFLIYSLSSYSLARYFKSQPRHNWRIEFGAGAYIDASRAPVLNSAINGLTTTAPEANFTFYVTGSYQIGPRWWLQASNWNIRDRTQDLNRIVVGATYNF